MRLSFTIPGEPVAKGRPRASVISGRARMYTPAKTQSYEAQAKWFAEQAISQTPGFEPISDRPISLSVLAVFAIPAGWSKRRVAACAESPEPCIKRPDSDNVLKIIGDALNGILWRDDSQVADACIRKVYGQNPRVEVLVEVMP